VGCENNHRDQSITLVQPGVSIQAAVLVKRNPISIATFPVPSERDYCGSGGKFGPHNMHENRRGSFQSSEVIFVTYQNAGLRVFSVANPFRPEEIAAFVPSPPPGLAPARPIASADVFVDRRGLVYLTDAACGLQILEFVP
jgi:hypothetical protein